MFKTTLVILLFLVTFSMEKVSARCVPMYDQNPSQEQVDAYNHGVDVGVSGGYAVSKQVGCEPESEGSGWGFLWYLGAVGFIVYIGSRR
jgi:hypothetical protein